MLKKTINFEYNQFIGTSKDRKSRKIHAIIDGIRNFVSFLLSDDQVHNSKVEILLLLETTNIAGSHVIPDRAYELKKIRIYIEKQKANYIIPPKKNANLYGI